VNRTLRSVAALATVVLLGASCSKEPADTGTDTSADRREQGVRFAECMRDNGVTGFPDPDASGQLTIEAIANGSSVDPNTAAFTQALSACKDLEPAGFTGNRRTPQQQEAGLRFAQCIRDNGVRDFPDPGPDDALVDTNRIPSAATDAGMRALNAAMQRCDASAAGVTGP
jgi:hypothetical protein